MPAFQICSTGAFRRASTQANLDTQIVDCLIAHTCDGLHVLQYENYLKKPATKSSSCTHESLITPTIRQHWTSSEALPRPWETMPTKPSSTHYPFSTLLRLLRPPLALKESRSSDPLLAKHSSTGMGQSDRPRPQSQTSRSGRITKI